jgi:ferredoxin
MAFVVCEPCRDCKYTDCVVVCPIECFYQDEAQLYIHPIDCIDCEACVPECPVEAIFSDRSVPSAWVQFVQLNAERSAILKASGDQITEKQDALLGPRCGGVKR